MRTADCPASRLKSAAKELDSLTMAIELEVPSKAVVLLQSYFELYEGLGTVRTIGTRTKERTASENSGRNGSGRDASVAQNETAHEEGRQLVCVATPRDQLEVCCEALAAIQEAIDWRPPYRQDVAAG